MSSKPFLCSHGCCKDEAVGFTANGDPVCEDHFSDAEEASDLFDDDPAEREREAFMRLARAQ